MIGKLIVGLLNIISKVVGILLLPLDYAVTALLPDLSNVITSITNYLNLPLQIMGWVFELVHIPKICLQIIVAFWVFKYACTGAIAGTKKVITLYQRFKL